MTGAAAALETDDRRHVELLRHIPVPRACDSALAAALVAGCWGGWPPHWPAWAGEQELEGPAESGHFQWLSALWLVALPVPSNREILVVRASSSSIQPTTPERDALVCFSQVSSRHRQVATSLV